MSHTNEVKSAEISDDEFECTCLDSDVDCDHTRDCNCGEIARESTRMCPEHGEPAIRRAWNSNLADWARVYNTKVCMDLIWAHELTDERMEAVKDYLLENPEKTIEEAVDVVIDGHNQAWYFESP